MDIEDLKQQRAVVKKELKERTRTLRNESKIL